MPNNYDQSSTGINIESDVWYDSNLACTLFNENFYVIEQASYHKTAVFFYTSGNSLPSWKDITFTLKATREELERYYNTEGLECNAFTLSEYNDTELAEVIMEFVSLDIVSYFSDTIMFEGYQIKAVPSTQIKRVLVRGYSQSHAAYVIYTPLWLQEEAWGREDTPCDEEITAPFENYFYNAPIHGAVTINGVEFPYYECEATCEYTYDRARWIDYIMSSHNAPEGLTREALEAVIPQKPSYD